MVNTSNSGVSPKIESRIFELTTEATVKVKMVELKLKTIVHDYAALRIQIDQIKKDVDFVEYGINSITYFKILVAIEAEFGFEFGDNDLGPYQFKSLETLLIYVMDKVL